MNAFYGAFGRGVVRFRWLVVIAWVLITIVSVRALPSLSSQVNNNNGAFLPASAPSNKAAVLAEPLIGSVNQSNVEVVLYSTSGSLSVADEQALNVLKSALGAVPTVREVRFLGAAPNGKAVQLLVTSSDSPFDQGAVTTLGQDLESALGHVPLRAGLHADLAGQVATNYANQQASQKTGKLTQSLSILFILVLLLIIFRSVLAPLVTLLPAVLVLQLSGSFIGALGAHGLKISAITQLLMIVLILGAGTDYGLFLVFRVREEMQRGADPRAAVETAVLRVGESITASAATVIVALLSLTLASFGIYHDLGVPLAIGIAVMLLAGVTLLPALVAILGPVVFWPSKLYQHEPREGLWGRVAGRLVARPAVTLTVGVVVFGALALAALGYRPGGFGGAVTAPAGSQVAAGNAAVAANFPQSSNNPTNLVMRFDTPVWADPTVLSAASAELDGSGLFSSLTGPLDPNGRAITPAQLTALHAELGPAVDLPAVPPAGQDPALYNAYRATARYISGDGSTVQWQAGLRAGDPGTTAALNAVPAIRDEVSRVAEQVGATASGVAGEAPALHDVSTISDGDLRHIVPIAVLAIGIVLALVLRSLVAPLYLIASVVLSYLASLGLTVIVFMGIGGQEGITFLLPFLMFIFLLALGEDYNILVMTRIREEATTLPLRPAVIRAVGATGPTVTSAGLVLAGTFAVFAIAGSRGPGGSGLKEIGFGLTVGILLDTFVVRTVLVPATVSILGRWNWWPSKMSRLPEAPPPAEPAVVGAGSERSGSS
ncbi:MAG TPA: MMPL family transporter [Acidimicrobiales bacterium]|nr:MMPL family transporter [Acidimicrobiales bacterium]